jgi:hypothetical protein
MELVGNVGCEQLSISHYGLTGIWNHPLPDGPLRISNVRLVSFLDKPGSSLG